MKKRQLPTYSNTGERLCQLWYIYINYLFHPLCMHVKLLICCISFFCTIKWISYIYTYPLPWTSPEPHPTHLGHQRALSWVPSSIQQVPTSCLHMQCTCISSNLSIHPAVSLCPLVSTHLFSMSASLFLPCKIGSSVPFFYIPHTYVNFKKNLQWTCPV